MQFLPYFLPYSDPLPRSVWLARLYIVLFLLPSSEIYAGRLGAGLTESLQNGSIAVSRERSSTSSQNASAA